MISLLVKFCSDAIIEELLKLHKPIKFDPKSIDVSRTSSLKFGHYQLNDCIFLSKVIENNVSYLHKLIFIQFKKYFAIFDVTVYFFKPCFINFKFSNYFLGVELVKAILNFNNILKLSYSENVFLDYSSPNVAKEMHVGHLRSTIIGNFFFNLFKAVGHKVIAVSHLGDWGTQFGMLIHYLKTNVNDINNVKFTLRKLNEYYKKANLEFLNNEVFKIQSKQEVVKLQNGNTFSLFIWRRINSVSRVEYNKIYKLLGVNIECKGESFYRHLLSPIVLLCEKKKIVSISNQAKCIYIDGFLNVDNKPLPVIIKKADNGFNYATTEIATLYYRIKYHKPDKIIYVTDIGQTTHFNMIFKIIEYLKIKNNKTQLIHIGFGLMLNDDNKKIKTRAGDSVKLKSFIMNSIIYAKKILGKKKYKNIKLPHILAINTIKYADLSNKLSQNYIFNYDRLLKFKGNTAMFLMYAYARICSIKKKYNEYNNTDKMKKISCAILTESIELDLVLYLLQYRYIILKTIDKLDPTILTSYLYNIAEKFHSFFHSCNVLNSNYGSSRLLICEMVQHVLASGFKILGLKLVNKI